VLSKKKKRSWQKIINSAYKKWYEQINQELSWKTGISERQLIKPHFKGKKFVQVYILSTFNCFKVDENWTAL
jgi:hypothetical protein